ncbi:hypothetical protein L1987_31007 [Smallanthus sonchifolius]|uniref:Uncharacterized protein n=1 Tax=Smallanthus sonchifolius TaxID=185202 RepID=A0ACB9I503_9ASTR|nr:hypothetical protein L1987_31007 [Smallanthus sonchifolius]
MRPSTQMNRREVQDAIFFANGMKRSRVNSVSGAGGGFQFNRTIISESSPRCLDDLVPGIESGGCLSSNRCR